MAAQIESIKWVPGTKFIVDGFAFLNPKCQHYFLTHCHSDHTCGLRRRFDAGTIWCSPVSAKLLAAEWNLRAPTVQVLQLNQPTAIDGVSVTALDANHCPGAVMLLFEVSTAQGTVKRILHTGDCRWQDRLYTSSCLADKPIDTLMLDTTYALPKHTFPPQEEAISQMVQVMREALQEEPDTLLVVSSYHIGKERAYLGAAAALGLKVYVPPAKQRVLQLLDLSPQLLALVTSTDPSSQLHVGCTSLAPEELQVYLAKQQEEGSRAWARIMGFRATGWAYRRSGGLSMHRPCDNVTLVGVPYSEHSSWLELRQCVGRLRPKRLVPTVNAVNRSQQDALVDRFADLMDLSACRSRIDAYLVRPAPPAAAAPAGAGAAAGNAAATAAKPVEAAAGAGAVPGSAVDAADALTPAHSGLDPSLFSSGSPSSRDSSDTVRDLTAPHPAASEPQAQASDVDQGRSQLQGAEQDEVGFDIDSVDVSEQLRLLEDAERRQRLKKSVQAAANSKQQQRKRVRPRKVSQGPVLQPNTLKKGGKQQKLV